MATLPSNDHAASIFSPSIIEAAHAAAQAAALAQAPHLASLSLLSHPKATNSPLHVPLPFALPHQLPPHHGPDDTIPIIDLSPLTHPSSPPCPPQDRARIARAIISACEKWGFFQVINHGVPQDLLTQVQVQGTKTFEVPTEVKVRSARNLTLKHSGYGTAASTTKGGPLPWSEAFTIMGRPQQNTQECASTLWSEDAQSSQREDFCTIMDTYIKALQNLGNLLMELLLDGYGISKNHFEDAFIKDPQETLRLNHYPPCPEPSKTVGLNTHVDTNCFTIVHDGGVAGLQVRANDGRYVAIAPRQDGFAVNVGDMLEVLTYGRCKSVFHRVVVNKDESRLSTAFFVSPSLSSTISPHPELVDGSSPIYNKRKFTWGEYYLSRRILCTTSSLDEFLNGSTCDQSKVASY